MNTDAALDALHADGKLRRYIYKGRTYVFAVDACRACGLKNTVQSIRRLAPSVKRRHEIPTPTGKGKKTVWLLTVDGFLALVGVSATQPDRHPIIAELHTAMIRAASAEIEGHLDPRVRSTRPVPDAVYQLAEPVLRDVVLSANQFATFEDHHKEIGYQRYLRLCEYYAAGGREPFPVASGHAMTEGRRISEKEFQRWFRPARARLEKQRQDNIRRYESHQLRLTGTSSTTMMLTGASHEV